MSGRVRNSVIVPAILLLPVVVLLAVLAIGHVMRSGFRSMDDFSVLWETTDLISRHLVLHEELPETWDDLSEHFDEINDGYGSPDIEYVQERIEINFDHEGDEAWIVRVRSGRIKPEEDEANQRLSHYILALRERGAEEE